MNSFNMEHGITRRRRNRNRRHFPISISLLVMSTKAFLHRPPLSTPLFCNHKWKSRHDSPQLMATQSNNTLDDEPKHQKYLRIQSRLLGEGKRKVDFQTAIVTMSKTAETGDTFSIDLHAQCHFGDKAYFDYFNDQHRFTDQYDRVHYELLISNTLLSSHPSEEQSLVLSPHIYVAPSPHDAYTAKQYNLYCQLDVINYAQPKWVHCDYTREDHTTATSNTLLSQPIWALASTQSSIPALEFLSAFTRPLTPSTPLSSSYNRRLFSKLFISGDAMISCLRFLLWFLVPSPELSVMLLDWSSLFPRPFGSISRIVNPVLTSLFSGDFHSARKLVFAQMLTSGQGSSASSSSSNDKEEWIVTRRNENAIQKICTSMNRFGNKKHALLYGALHGPDLQKRLEQLGFHIQKVDWRTAWSVTVAEFGTGGVSRDSTNNRGERKEERSSWGNFAIRENPGDWSLGLVVVPLYLIVGGLDWLDMVQTIKTSVDRADLVFFTLTLSLYLGRHLALYLSISKFVIEWDGPSSSNLFEADERIS